MSIYVYIYMFQNIYIYIWSIHSYVYVSLSGKYIYIYIYAHVLVLTYQLSSFTRLQNNLHLNGGVEHFLYSIRDYLQPGAMTPAVSMAWMSTLCCARSDCK